MAEKNYFQADVWFNQKVEERTLAALKQMEKEFPEKHEQDSKEKLLEYVKECSQAIGHSPNQVEVIGGSYIAKRFGGWACVLQEAGLPKPGMAPALTRRYIYKKENKRQAKLFKQERKEHSANRAEQMRAKAKAELLNREKMSESIVQEDK